MKINVLQGTRVHFINNTAKNGGAMSLHGFSMFEIHPGSQIVFHSNHASELGGAVYATSPQETEFGLSQRCFISFSDTSVDNPEKLNSTVVLTNNSAHYEHFLFTDSIIPCQKQILRILSNISNFAKWQTFIQSHQSETYVIATSPVAINFTLPPLISPGEVIHIRPISFDELNQPLSNTYKVIFDSDTASVKTDSQLISNKCSLENLGHGLISHFRYIMQGMLLQQC